VEGENLPVDVNEELRVRGYQIKFVLKIEKYPELITQTKVFQNRSPFSSHFLPNPTCLHPDPESTFALLKCHFFLVT
jgi:hypothetical protein